MTILAEQYITQEILDVSNLTRPRLEFLCECAQKIRNIEGAIVEVGVYKGGSAKLLRTLFPDRELWLYDTFTGNPCKGPHDPNPIGSYACSLDKVRDFLDDEAIHWVQGLFPQTLETPPPIALAHLDCDQEQSVKASAMALLPLVSGLIICDDYGYCRGARDGFNDACGSRVNVSDTRQAWAHGDLFQ